MNNQKKIVLALGGNALGNSPKEQLEIVKDTAKSIVDLIEEDMKVAIVHGNGPQVGMINLAMSTSAESKAKTPEMPFAECGSMSQGYIGYHLQNAIKNELSERNIQKSVATVITQVLVDKNDPAFLNPTKPIGTFYSKEEAEVISKDRGYDFVEDSGRGYRRVVPSPKPLEIIEKDIINNLLDNGFIVIAGGGGGVPVIKEGDKLVGVDAVIDKDFTSAMLAQNVDADKLVILTAVEKVAINFGKENEKFLDEITISQARRYADNGEFGEGSMKPKVEAMISFVESKEEREAIITLLEKSKEGIEGKTGTIIKKD